MSFISAESFTNWQFYKELKKQRLVALQAQRCRGLLLYSEVFNRVSCRYDCFSLNGRPRVTPEAPVIYRDASDFDKDLEKLDLDITRLINDVFERLDREDLYPVSYPTGQLQEQAAAVDHKSAYQLAVENGYVGSEEQWLKDLREPGGTNRYHSEIVVDKHKVPWYSRLWSGVKSFFS